MGRHRLNYGYPYDPRHGYMLDNRNRPIDITPELHIAHSYSRMVGERIRRERKAQSLTQGQAVRLVEHPRGGRYSPALLSRIENGWANAPLFVYIHIAEVLGIDPAEILGPEPDAERG